MAVVWGRAEIEVDVDGSGIPRQIRQLAQRAGDVGGEQMGNAFNKSFAQRLREGLRGAFSRFNGFFRGLWARMFRRGGQSVGDSFTDGFKDSMKEFRLEFDKVSTDVVRRSTEMARTVRDVDFGRWADDFGRFTQVFRELETNRLALPAGSLEDWGELRQVFDDAGDSARRTSGDFHILWRELESGDTIVRRSRPNFDAFRNSISLLGRGMGRIRTAIGGFGNFFRNYVDGLEEADDANRRSIPFWQRLSHNTRQWTLIIAAVTAALPQLATLSSAVGAGILVLGGAVAAFGVGLGATISSFVRFTGDIEKLPASLLPARKAFDDFKESFSDLNEAITEDAFAGTQGAWASLAKTVRGLIPAFRPVARVINGLIKDFAEFFEVGGKGFEDLEGFITKSAPIFDSLARSAGLFGEALLTVFNNPGFQRALQGFVGWIGDLAQSFDDFANSNALTEWFDNARLIFDEFGELLETTFGVLNDLVDDEAVQDLVNFFDAIEEFMATGGAGILEFAKQLDIFGLLAEGLADFGTALEPLAKPMADLAEGLNAVVNSGIDTLAPIIEGVAEALAPFVQAVADFMNENPKAFADALLAIAGAIAIFKVAKAISVAGAIGKFGKLKGLAGNVATIVALTGALDTLFALFDENKDADAGISALSGALLGMRFGPVGALVGTLTGLVTSMIDDVFLSPETKGAWVQGWEQLFDPNNYTGAGIGPLKQWFQENLMGPDPSIPESGGGWLDQVVTNWQNTLTNWRDNELPNFWPDLIADFELGWTQITTWFDENVGSKFEEGWNQIVTFFTEGIPGFFTTIGEKFQTGWTQITTWFDENVGSKFRTGWEQIVTFFTEGVPGFFTMIGQKFQQGWTQITTFVDTHLVRPVKNLWTGFVLFWTVAVPAWFNSMATKFRIGLATLTAPFTNFFNDVKRNWNNFWLGLTIIVSQVWNTIVNAVRGPVNTVIGIINGMIAKINEALGLLRSLSGGLLNFQLPSLPSLPGAAAGTILTGPTRILAGEAGPEAIVPLNRALSQVDPSVRWLSAIAQGKTASMAGGGMVGGRSVTVEAGAIVVSGVRDEFAAANIVINDLVQRVAS